MKKSRMLKFNVQPALSLEILAIQVVQQIPVHIQPLMGYDTDQVEKVIFNKFINVPAEPGDWAFHGETEDKKACVLYVDASNGYNKACLTIMPKQLELTE